MSESFFAWLAIAALLLGLHAPRSSRPTPVRSSGDPSPKLGVGRQPAMEEDAEPRPGAAQGGDLAHEDR